MRILAISDVTAKYYFDYYTPGKLDGFDLILACGDLHREYLEFLVTMSNKPVLYVHGNHDEGYDQAPPGGCTCIDDTIYVYEFKSGTGPLHHDQVLAQCKLYALGLINEFDAREKIVLEIIKPGRNFDQCITLTSDELIQWGEETMVPLVRGALQGERAFRPGPYCNICPGRPLCRAWVEQMITMLVSRYGRGATVSPQQAPKLSEQEVSELLGLLGDIESCQRPLEEWAVGHIQHGGTIPGYRLGHNPGNLRFHDEATVREILEAHGLWERGLKLRTPREMRQAIGDEAYQMVASYAVRSPGRDVLRRDDTVVGGPAQ